MAPLFPTASWLEHLGCRKHLLRFSLSRRWFGHSPLTLISRTGTLWRAEGREKSSLFFYFCKLVTLTFFIPVLLYVLRQAILFTYCIQILLCWTHNSQLDLISNITTEQTEKKQNRNSISFSTFSFKRKWVPTGFQHWYIRFHKYLRKLLADLVCDVGTH